MAQSVYFSGEVWPVFHVYGHNELGNPSVVKAPIDIIMLGGHQYICTVGCNWPSQAAVNNAQHDSELKWRSEFGPWCLAKAQCFNACEFGTGADSILGVHKFGFV